MADPSKRAIPKEKPRRPVVLPLLALALLLVFYLWKFVLVPREPAIPVAPLSPRPTGIERLDEPPPPGPEDLAAVPDRPAPAVDKIMPAPPEDECIVTARQIDQFFSDLDRRDYIRSRQLPAGSRAHLEGMVERLLTNPPIVSGETDSLTNILNNTAHLYRVLQKNDLLLFKEILDHEGAELENTLELFHRWSLLAPQCPPEVTGINLPLAAAYEYAGFFLNTLGGRSYLFRRESRVRSLVKYYSVLTLDRANDAGLNRHGLDIRPAIINVTAEIRNQQSLKQRREYIANLDRLQDKYQRHYGE